jgi:5'-methylthioadenosine phosphorylase
MIKVGIIGGSGLDDPDLLVQSESVAVDTPYGAPSSSLTCGRLNGAEIVMLARHGRQHQFSPSQVNYRANIHALKTTRGNPYSGYNGMRQLREEIGRGHFVVLDQFIDLTRHRNTTFFDSFENGTRHTSMADPFDPGLRNALVAAARELNLNIHPRGTVVTIEGPRFSSRAESKMYRQWGADVINMSIAPEAILANEIAIPYAAVAMSTDYDCWKENEAPVSWEEILAVFNQKCSQCRYVAVKHDFETLERALPWT